LVALYDAEISYHDAHFASMIEGLERRGLSDNTMIVITADHGEEFWDHGSVGHGHSVYDELLHVPLVVKVPGITQQTTAVTDAVGLVDVLPTVLDVLGQAVPDHLAGHSFLPQLLGHGSTAPRTAVSGFMTGWRTLAVGHYKLVQRTAAHTMLYDVGADPSEQTNIADSRPIALRYLRGQLGLVLDGQTTATASSSVAAAPRPRPTHKAERTEIDAETDAQVRALGYVGTSAH
jgi:arylsulfatase A-like enzyme